MRSDFDELFELQTIVESEVFQKHIAEPMKKFIKEQRNSFFSDSLKESWRKGGRVEGARELFRILKIERENFIQARNERQIENS